MHEASLMADLIRKITAIARAQRANTVTGIRLKLGALSHISPDHVRVHFAHTARGTVAEGAWLEVEVLTDLTDAMAQDILLESIEVIPNAADGRRNSGKRIEGCEAQPNVPMARR